MAYDVSLKTDPNPLPIKPAILLLIHKRKKAMYISYTTNARGRGAVLTSAIRHRSTTQRGHLRDLPDGGVQDFAILAANIGLEARKANAMVERYQRKYQKEGYTLFGAARSAVPLVHFNSRRMSLVDAMAEAKCKDNYQTVYRRIQRGWTAREALGVAERS